MDRATAHLSGHGGSAGQWGPRGDAARVACSRGRALRLPLLARPLSDRDIGAVPGGRGSPGGGHPAGGAQRRRATWQCVWTRRGVCAWWLLAVTSLCLCWGRAVGTGGWRGQALPGEWGRELRAARGCRERAAGLRDRVSVSLVMGPAGCWPPPWPGFPAGVGNGGSGAPGARDGGHRSCDPGAGSARQHGGVMRGCRVGLQAG